MSPLEALFSDDPASDSSDALESFVAQALFEAGVWSSPRTSDGVASYRVVECAPARFRACGRIWEIDQTQRAFWLDVERTAAGVAWTLYFDIDETALGARRARHALDAIRDAREIGWRVTLKGIDGASG